MMNPFGAASGVDPQSGSYLSKEQRKAMFRASRGQASSSGAANGRGGALVKAQTSMVVVNKLGNVAKTLESNISGATENIAEQIARNRESINDLYGQINDIQEREIKKRNKYIKKAVKDKQSLRMSMRERMIEGVAGLAAATAAGGKKIVDAASKPVIGFLDRIKNALLSLAGAWLIRNMPTILAQLEEMFSDFDKTKREVTKQLLKQRGWGSAIELFIRKLFGKITGTARLILRLTRFIGSKISSITGRIFNALKNFTGRVFGHILTTASRLFKDFLEQAKRLVPQKAKDFARGIKNSGVGRAAGAVIDAGKKVVKGVIAVGGDLLRGDPKKALGRISRGIAGIGQALKDKAFNTVLKPLQGMATAGGVDKLDDGARATGLNRLLKPITDRLPGAASKGLGKTLLARVPVLGILVDVALNKAGGLSWVNSIINGIAEGMGGMTGAGAGYAVGSTVGAGVGALAGFGIGAIPGKFLGGALGALVGSMIGASLARGTVNLGREALGQEAVAAPDMPGSVVDAVGNLTGLYSPEKDKPEAVKLNLPATFEGTESTPEGMSMPDGFGSSFNINVTEMPPVTTKLTKEEPAKAKKVESPPALSATDSEMDQYRGLALTKYQLAF